MIEPVQFEPYPDLSPSTDEEPKRRRFKLHGVSPDDPTWEDVAQSTRNDLAWSAYDNHRKYYDSHPQDLAKLNALVLPPSN